MGYFYPMWLVVFFWGGGVLQMTCRAATVIWLRSIPIAFLTTAPIKSSKYTGMMYIASSFVLCLGFFFGCMYYLKTWWERSTFLSMAWCMRSWLVLVAAHNYIVTYDQPIFSTDGTTNCMGLPGGLGITYAKFHLVYSSTIILQNPYVRSILESITILSVPTKLMKCSRWQKTSPISLAGACSAKRSVVSLTLDWIV